MEVPVLRIRTTGLAWRDVNGEVIALDLDSSSYFSTNHSGALMWRALVEGGSVDQLIDLLRSEYGLSRADASIDVNEFLGSLREHGLLDDGT